MGFQALILDPPLISSGHTASWSLVSHQEAILEGWGTVMVSAGFSIESPRLRVSFNLLT